MKIGIVGAEEAKWSNEDTERFLSEPYNQIVDCKARIFRVLNDAVKLRELFVPIKEYSDNSVGKIPGNEIITLVSGRCPVAPCENCGSKFALVDDPLEGYFTCNECGLVRKKRKGGVDIWAELAADSIGIGIVKEIYNPQNMGWEDKDGESGFRTRNIDIAKASDVLFCFSPMKKDAYCKHCKETGHVGNGGCWTLDYFRKHYKRRKGFQVVVGNA